jgi:hypothetical protein
MARIDLEVVRGEGRPPAVTVRDSIERRLVASVADVRNLLSDRGGSLTKAQYHGLGLLVPVIANEEYAGRYTFDQLGKVLDAIYFPANTPLAGQAFSRGMGEALFALRRGDSVDDTSQELLSAAQDDFESAEE